MSVSNADDITRWLADLARWGQRGGRQALFKGGLYLEGQVKARVQGRPGPRRITGNCLGSWSTQQLGGELAVSVGSNAPQARRLEYGFHGADSLGRVYSQPAFPHLEPAVLASADRIVEIIGAAWDEAAAG